MSKCNVVLSGSGTKLFYFIGVLKALHINSFNIQAIAGTSGGSLIASLYAFTKSPDLLYQIATSKTIDISKIVSINWFGLLKKEFSIYKFNRDKFYKTIDSIIGKNNRMIDSKIPLKIVASNISKKEITIFYKEKQHVGLYIIASMSVPFVFPHVKIGDNYYIDGVVCKNLLADAWIDRDLDELTILVYFKSKNDSSYQHNFKNFVSSIIDTTIQCGEDDEIEDVKRVRGNKVITIPIYTSLNSLDFNLSKSDIEFMIKDGFKQTMLTLEEYRKKGLL